MASLIASTPTTAVTHTRDSLFRTLFSIALGGTLLALLLAAVVGDRIGAGLRRLTVAARGIQRGEYAVELLGLPFVPLSEFRPEGFNLIVNATPVGRDHDGFPFTIETLSNGTLVIDRVPVRGHRHFDIDLLAMKTNHPLGNRIGLGDK